MSDHRSKDQTLIAVPLSKAFLAEVDAVRGDLSRSAFVRAALFEKVSSIIGGLSPEISYAPSRTGKGGKPSHHSKTVEDGRKLPQTAVIKSPASRKPKLSPVPGNGKPDEKVQAG